jgi:hypothetical protein
MASAAMLMNSRASSASRPDPAGLVLDHEKPRPQRGADAFEPEPRAQVDDPAPLVRGKHHTFDEPRRVRHRRHMVEHLHVDDPARS